MFFVSGLLGSSWDRRGHRALRECTGGPWNMALLTSNVIVLTCLLILLESSSLLDSKPRGFHYIVAADTGSATAEHMTASIPAHERGRWAGEVGGDFIFCFEVHHLSCPARRQCLLISLCRYVILGTVKSS